MTAAKSSNRRIVWPVSGATLVLDATNLTLVLEDVQIWR